MEDKDLIKLSGTVDSVVFRSEESGFAVIKMVTEDDLVTVIGDLGNIEEGEDLCCTGSFEENSRFGTQFRAQLTERSLPTSVSAIRRYLTSGVIESITPALAKKIVDCFGEDSLDVIENDRERLATVSGISAKKAEKISEDFRKTFAVRSLMVMINRFELPASVSVRSWKMWGEDAQDIIMSNPYVLCRSGIDVSFTRADGIARSQGVPADSPERVRAGIIWILKDYANQGYTAVPFDELRERALPFLSVDAERFSRVMTSELEEENIHEYLKDGRVFVMLHDYYKAEDYIARRLKIMSELSYDTQMDYSEIIDLAEEENGIKYEETQRKAINLALSKGFLILTGGPGTGKTTTLNGILSLFEQQAKNVMLAAPTGRAAKRLSDLTGHEAKTIHRLLEVNMIDDEHHRFVHDENTPLDCDVLIIDEMSMVDSCLFEAVLRAISVSCKLVLVGDSDQLPSVGPGNVLRDIIDSGVMPVVTLTEIFRQSQKSSIVTNAHKIVRGEYPDVTERDNDFFFMQRQTYPELQQLVLDLCRERLPRAYGYDVYNNIQVLSPTRQGPAGTVKLNELLQKELNPKAAGKSEVVTQFATFRVGDKVMQTRNDYNILWKRSVSEDETEEGSGIFNGDIGIVIKANKVLKSLTIDFDGRIAEYTSEMLDKLELAYAVTVHKSQGSEFDAVILALFGGFDKLYYRNLLYTAVTRARKLLIIIGTRKRLYTMIDNDHKAVRYTCLKEMILESGDF